MVLLRYLYVVAWCCGWRLIAAGALVAPAFFACCGL